MPLKRSISWVKKKAGLKKDDSKEGNREYVGVADQDEEKTAQNVREAMVKNPRNKLMTASIVISANLGDKDPMSTVDTEEIIMIADWIHDDKVDKKDFVKFAGEIKE